MSVIDLARPGSSRSDLRRLAGDLPRDDASWPLEIGRLPLYVCPVCGDLGCGAITVAVDHGSVETTWSDLRHEDGLQYDDETDDDGFDPAMSSLGPFTFLQEQYRDTLLRPVSMLLALDEADRESRVAHHREQNRAIRRRREKRSGRH